MRKKLSAYFLAILTAAALFSGCGGVSSETAAGAGDSGEQATKASESTGESGELSKLSIFINMSWYPVDSFTGKIPDAIKAATGTDLDVTIATDSKQLGVMIASGELPDLVFSDTEINELSNSNVCIPLDELAEMTGVSFENAENYDERTRIASTLSEDGRAYTLLNNYNSNEDWDKLKLGAQGQTCIYYRQDLLEAAGIEVPTNLEEFRNCLKEVKTAYPEMTPLGMGGYWKLQPISIWTGVSQGKYDGKEYRYESATPEYKSFLKYANSLYRDGLISAEEYANENEEIGHQRAYNDGCVFYPWYLANSNFTQLQSNAVSDSAKWAVLAPLGQPPLGDGKGWGGLFISRNCGDVTAAARLFAYLNSVEGGRTSMWGVEGDDWMLDENGVPQFSEEFLEARGNSEVWYSKYNTMFYFGASAIDEIYMNYSGMEEDKLKEFSAYSKGFVNYPELGIAKPSTTSEEGVIYTKLEDIRKKYEAKAIFSDTDEDFESACEEFMKALDSAGIGTYNTYMTEQIQKVKQEFGF
ncbi:extracellular solute-binding protein [Lachnoclostridium sp. Marseille-P6806]|uniref:extracellular solute-binding protein n=1 Tax=Lachnoclostridium sp. Marseille-P6806 TaxID=2364793 RepID=UPI0010315CAC|nr:extracellular solute-binding protein [Lachnoclostridium sp. Marseille-P6806]